MKTQIRILIAGALCAWSGLLFAVPLSVLIVQESEKIADSIRAFNKECTGVNSASPKYEKCFKKRSDIGGQLSGLVVLVQEELNLLPAQEGDGQRGLRFQSQRGLQLQLHWAQYWFGCLGRENDSECTPFKAALAKATGADGLGIMDIEHPTHEGNEEAKHWHAVKIK